MSFDPWRLACPHGHRNVSRIGKTKTSPQIEKQWKCGSCRRIDSIDGYRYKQVKDLKTGELVDP